MSDNNGWPDPARPGVPMNPERDGWHWLLDGNHEPYLLRWGSDNQRWGDYPGSSATDLAEFGIGYLGPCLTPAEVEARVQQARRDGRQEAAQEIDCGCDIRAAVLERLKTQSERQAERLCPKGDTCCALHAAAIRALKGEGDD